MSAPPPCAGQWKLFDSTDPVDHKEAVALCNGCPIITHCAQQLAESRAESCSPAYGPAGTWAGQLVGAPAAMRQAEDEKRRAAEDALFTEAEARNCALRWLRGEHNDYTKVGRRVYERRGRQARQAARKGEAA